MVLLNNIIDNQELYYHKNCIVLHGVLELENENVLNVVTFVNKEIKATEFQHFQFE